MNIIQAVATGDAVNSDALADNPEDNRKPWARRIVSAAFVGSAVIGDAEVHLYIEGTKVGEFLNSKVAQAPNRDDFTPQSVPVPAGALIRLLVIVAPTTNDGQMHLITAP